MNKKKIHSAFLTKAWPGANRMTLFIIYSQASDKSPPTGVLCSCTWQRKGRWGKRVVKSEKITPVPSSHTIPADIFLFRRKRQRRSSSRRRGVWSGVRALLFIICTSALTCCLVRTRQQHYQSGFRFPDFTRKVTLVITSLRGLKWPIFTYTMCCTSMRNCIDSLQSFVRVEHISLVKRRTEEKLDAFLGACI